MNGVRSAPATDRRTFFWRRALHAVEQVVRDRVRPRDVDRPKAPAVLQDHEQTTSGRFCHCRQHRRERAVFNKAYSRGSDTGFKCRRKSANVSNSIGRRAALGLNIFVGSKRLAA